jgi:hypothetical protein
MEYSGDSVSIFLRIYIHCGKRVQSVSREAYQVKVQTAKRMVQIQEWAKQINECRQSGKSVKQWCNENGMKRKTFYYRQNRVREELLDVIETHNGPQTFETDSGYLPMKKGFEEQSRAKPYPKERQPVFTALAIPQTRGAVLTVQLGEFTVDIQNGADEILVGHVLRAVSRL